MTMAAPSHWRRLLAGPRDASHVLALAALFAPCVAVWATMGLSPLFALTAVAVLVLGWRDRVWTAFPRDLSLLLALICAWAALSAFWALDPARSLFSAVQLAVNAFGGVVLVGAARRLGPDGAVRVGTALVAGVILGLLAFALGLVSFRRLAILLQSLHQDEFGAYRIAIQVFNRGATVILLMAVPAMGFLWMRKRPRRAGLLGMAMVVTAVTAKALAAKLLVGIDLLALALFRRPSRVRGLALGVVLASLTVIIPLWAASLPAPQITAGWAWLPYSSHHRLTIWSFSAQRILEHPVLGWGMDSARSMPGGEDKEMVRMEIPRGSGSWVDVPEQKLPLHPHNAVLQWWLELGGVGAAMFAILLLGLARRAMTPGRTPLGSACAAALLMGCVAVSTVSFGFWQSWWQCVMWFLAAWFSALEPIWSPGISRDGADAEPVHPGRPPG